MIIFYIPNAPAWVKHRRARNYMYTVHIARHCADNGFRTFPRRIQYAFPAAVMSPTKTTTYVGISNRRLDAVGLRARCSILPTRISCIYIYVYIIVGYSIVFDDSVQYVTSWDDGHHHCAVCIIL